MLGGLDPIILFNFNQKFPSATDTASTGGIPIVSDIVDSFPLPPIPIYLSESLTGLFVDSEEKSVDVETEVSTVRDGKTPVISQKGLGTIVKINMVSNRESLGVALLSALIDRVFEKVTSKEYSISYLHGPIVVFGGLLHSFNISQNADDTRLNITMEIVRQVSDTIVPSDFGIQTVYFPSWINDIKIS